jgi:hypothetical protein
MLAAVASGRQARATVSDWHWGRGDGVEREGSLDAIAETLDPLEVEGNFVLELAAIGVGELVLDLPSAGL